SMRFTSDSTVLYPLNTGLQQPRSARVGYEGNRSGMLIPTTQAANQESLQLCGLIRSVSWKNRPHGARRARSSLPQTGRLHWLGETGRSSQVLPRDMPIRQHAKSQCVGAPLETARSSLSVWGTSLPRCARVDPDGGNSPGNPWRVAIHADL